MLFANFLFSNIGRARHDLRAFAKNRLGFARRFFGMNMNVGQLTSIPATGKHTATVFFFHGLGDTGFGWVPSLQTIRIPHVKYVVPTAPTVAVTWQKGTRMPAWFDIKNVTYEQYDFEEKSFRDAVRAVHNWIEEEMKLGIPSERIILGGFSQGGGLALYCAFTFDKPLAGSFALSSRLPLSKELPGESKPNTNLPVLQCHGEADQLTPVDIAFKVANVIKIFNSKHTLKTYPRMGHTSSEKELKDVKEFIEKHLPG